MWKGCHFAVAPQKNRYFLHRISSPLAACHSKKHPLDAGRRRRNRHSPRAAQNARPPATYRRCKAAPCKNDIKRKELYTTRAAFCPAAAGSAEAGMAQRGECGTGRTHTAPPKKHGKGTAAHDSCSRKGGDNRTGKDSRKTTEKSDRQRKKGRFFRINAKKTASDT